MLKTLVIILLLMEGINSGTATFEQTMNDELNSVVSVVEDLSEEESTDVDLLAGYEKYSEEYLGELYWNTIEDKVSYRDWHDLEDLGYDDSEIKYILLVKYDFIKP